MTAMGILDQLMELWAPGQKGAPNDPLIIQELLQRMQAGKTAGVDMAGGAGNAAPPAPAQPTPPAPYPGPGGLSNPELGTASDSARGAAAAPIGADMIGGGTDINDPKVQQALTERLGARLSGGRLTGDPAAAGVTAPPVIPERKVDNTPSGMERFRHEGLIGVLSGALGARGPLDRARETENLTVKALMKKGGFDQETAHAIARNPDAMKAIIPVLFGTKTLPDFGVFGEDQFGAKKYGFIDKAARTVTPANGGDAPAAGAGLTGDELLKALPKPIADQVKALSEGRMAFPSGFALKSPYWQRMIQIVSQYDPSFDAVNYNARNKTRADFTAGKSAQNLTAFNTAIQHLDTLDKSIDGLNNSGMPAWNKYIANPLASQLDPKYQVAIKNFETARTAVADELTRAFRGAGGNVHDIVQWEKTINAADTPAALKAAVKQAVELLRGRIESVGDQYSRGMGTTKDALELLSPKAKATIERLSGAGPAPARGGGGFRVIGVR